MIVKETQNELDTETAKRLERLDKEMTELENFKLTMFENTEGYDQIVIMKNVSSVARCEHHHCEFATTVHLGYIPGEWLIGASKFNRTVRKFLNLKVKTLQERATQQILNSLMELSPKGAMVIIEGKHSCIAHRGVRDNSTMITSAVGGVFKEDLGARQEFLALIR